MSKETLLKMVVNNSERLTAPLMGFPGTQLTNSSLKQNLFNPRLQASSIGQLAEKINPDIVFPMMDLSVEAGALGLPVRYPLNESPSVEAHPVQNSDELKQFHEINLLCDSRVWGSLETVRLLKRELDQPVCAYACGPFTLAGLLMGASEIMFSMIDNPEELLKILEFSTQMVSRYVRALEKIGADMICVLEPTAMMLSPDDYDHFAGSALSELCWTLKIPVILHICGNTGHIIENMCNTGVQALSLDTAVNLPEIMPRIPENIIVMGNVDPAGLMRRGTAEEVTNATSKLIASMTEFKNFIPSTGCDLPQDTPLENIQAFVDTVKTWDGKISQKLAS